MVRTLSRVIEVLQQSSSDEQIVRQHRSLLSSLERGQIHYRELNDVISRVVVSSLEVNDSELLRGLFSIDCRKYIDVDETPHLAIGVAFAPTVGFDDTVVFEDLQRFLHRAKLTPFVNDLAVNLHHVRFDS